MTAAITWLRFGFPAPITYINQVGPFLRTLEETRKPWETERPPLSMNGN